MNRSEAFFNHLADVREALVAAETVELFEGDDVSALNKVDSIIGALDEAFDTEKESKILARIRREIEDQEWTAEEYFSEMDNEGIEVSRGVIGTILEEAANGEIAPEDQEDKQDMFLASCLVTLQMAAEGLQPFKPEVSVGA